MNKKNPANAQSGKARKNRQKIEISPARVAACEILLRIERERAFSSILLPLYEEKLGAKDRGLCHELVLGVLRRQIFLDAVIEKFTKGKKLDAEVLIALRLGIYQLLFLDKIPAFSAINESVNLVKSAGKRSASGLVNAVLRNVQRRENFDFDFSDEIEKISFETSHPRWLIEKWIAEFGLEETKKISAANNEIARPAFRLTNKFHHSGAETQREVSDRLRENVSRSKILKDAFVANRIDEHLLSLAESGEVYFQDEASQMVADAVELKPGESFLEVCAAPGSKTGFISAKRKAQSANLIVAGDLYSHRVLNLKENLERQAAHDVEIVRYDAESELPFADGSFDRVLVDAPCSGTGTIRHNPEIRYFLQAGDFGELSRKQLRILQNASKIVKKGGALVYSTCSLETEENEAVIDKFLSENRNFKKTVPNVPKNFLTVETFGRTFPHRDAADGFFIAMLKREF